MSNSLELVLVLLSSAVLVVVLARSLRLPPMLGYLLVGVAIGPHALHWIPASAESSYAHLAEFGVVFLMFSIGLEFSLPKLFNMRRVVFGLGMGQVLLTLFAPTGAAWVLGYPWQLGFALGGALVYNAVRRRSPSWPAAAFGIWLAALIVLLGIVPAVYQALIVNPNQLAKETPYIASNIAAADALPGEAVLLSPACASFDEFRDFEERGLKYREWLRGR